jgi:hypothetical protein
MTESLNEAYRQRSIEVGYQKAVDLWIQEGRAFWMQFNIMMVINILIITIEYNTSYALKPLFVAPTIGIVYALLG